jgi:hypothetical protein
MVGKFQTLHQKMLAYSSIQNFVIIFETKFISTSSYTENIMFKIKTLSFEESLSHAIPSI